MLEMKGRYVGIGDESFLTLSSQILDLFVALMTVTASTKGMLHLKLGIILKIILIAL